jgi:hypothetical protein
VPNNTSLLIVSKTGSIPSGMVHIADGYTDVYNKGRSNTLNNHSFNDDYKSGYLIGWVEMHMLQAYHST